MSAYSIAFSPLLPQSALVVLAVAALAAVGLALFARRRGALARALAFALLFLALLDPSLTREDRRPLKDVVAVVIDQSGSQTIGNRAAQTEHARAELEKRLGALDNVETRFIEAGKSDSEEQGTRLFTALQSGLSDVPPDRIGAAILVTDGIVHDIPASAAALGFKAPLHALITGHEGERDRRIELVEAPRFGIVGQDQTISARVFDTADKGEPVAIEVRRDGEKIATLSAMVGQTINAKVRIEHAGPNVVELEVATLPGELTDVNNRAVITVEGVRDKLRVLLVSGEPHQGERMWRNLLKSDANVDLVHFTILRPPEKSTDGTPINELSLIAFPVADLFGRKIRDFDLIILDRYSSQSILPKRLFQQYRRLCARRRRAADGRGAGLRDAGGSLFFAARRSRARQTRWRSDRSCVPPDHFPRRRQASRHPRADRRRRLAAGVGPVVSPDQRRSHRRRQHSLGSRESASADSFARRQGTGGPAAERPDVALGARL